MDAQLRSGRILPEKHFHRTRTLTSQPLRRLYRQTDDRPLLRPERSAPRKKKRSCSNSMTRTETTSRKGGRHPLLPGPYLFRYLLTPSLRGLTPIFVSQSRRIRYSVVPSLSNLRPKRRSTSSSSRRVGNSSPVSHNVSLSRRSAPTAIRQRYTAFC